MVKILRRNDYKLDSGHRSDCESGRSIFVPRRKKTSQVVSAILQQRLEDKANARLIAAAPELLEACKGALRTLEFLTDYEPRPCNAINRLQQAISKAEGKQ